MSDFGEAFTQRPESNAAFWAHVNDSHLDQHPQYTDAITSSSAAHVAAADPHTGYRLESAPIAQADLTSGYRLQGVSSSAPSSPSRGDTWVDTDTMELLVYYGATTGWRLPWDQPWGYITSASRTSTQTGITSEVDISSLSATFTVVANRRYKLTLVSMVYSTVAGDNTGLRIMVGAVVVQDANVYHSAASNQVIGNTQAFVSPSPGSTTFKATIRRSTGTGLHAVYASTTYPTYLLIEDIGSSSSAPAS